jgi:hypothetical protein
MFLLRLIVNSIKALLAPLETLLNPDKRRVWRMLRAIRTSTSLIPERITARNDGLGDDSEVAYTVFWQATGEHSLAINAYKEGNYQVAGSHGERAQKLLKITAAMSSITELRKRATDRGHGYAFLLLWQFSRSARIVCNAYSATESNISATERQKLYALADSSIARALNILKLAMELLEKLERP